MKNPHAAALGKLGGKAKSPAKAKSARENGRKGGRPRKAEAGPPKLSLAEALAKVGITTATITTV